MNNTENKPYDSLCKQHLTPLNLTNKEIYIRALLNIEHSYTGRLDGNICNTFVMESCKLLWNAINLFQMGYFDCAYYSLRTSIELCITMVFFDDVHDQKTNKALNEWKNLGRFPMQSELSKIISTDGEAFKDIREHMPDYFYHIKNVNQEINKYVHKQGLNFFYVHRSNPLVKTDDEEFIQSFEHYLKECISAIAVLRLAVDPFPVLLMENDIKYRYPGSITDAYDDDFVKCFIGEEVLQQYKKTALYQQYYEEIMDNEKCNEYVFNIIQHSYIDTSHYELIKTQFHLMYIDDVICTILCCATSKVVKAYSQGGFHMYFTDRKTNRVKTSWSGRDFMSFSESKTAFNQAFDEAFISVVHIVDQDYYVEHNESFADKEIDMYMKTVYSMIKEVKSESELLQSIKDNINMFHG